MAIYDDMNAPVRRSVTQLAGAVCSLAVMLGIGAWGTTMVIRDVSGVPVVRAIQGEMRRAPDHAGGRIADHGGLSVNEIAARGEAGGPEDILLLAPSGSDLAEEDLEATPTPTVTADAAADADAAIAADALAVADAQATEADRLADDDRLAFTDDPASDLPNDQMEPAVTMTDTATIDPVAAALAEAMQMDLGPRDVDAKLALTLRPALRPARTAVPASPSAQALLVPASLTTEEIPAPRAAVLTESLPLGTKLVQLGAFPTPQAAQAEWERLSVRFSDYMGDKARVIQKASSGGATFYRLRASGFGDLADARRFCATLDAARAACIPVIVR